MAASHNYCIIACLFRSLQSLHCCMPLRSLFCIHLSIYSFIYLFMLFIYINY
jgi:hypothetical protein